LALASALAFVAPRRALRAGLLTVDHCWDDASAQQAERVARHGRDLGLDPVEVLRAASPRSEGAARDNRRSALAAAAGRLGAACVLLGHTLDDQAETVLLRLARGSGARSLAGIPPADALVRRPLLGIRREQTRAACLAEGLQPWDDPSNADPAFTRARVRHTVLPVLEAELGPGIAEALARTADLLRADADALDADAAAAFGRVLRAAVNGVPVIAETAAGAGTAGAGTAGTGTAGTSAVTGTGKGSAGRPNGGSVTLDVAALAALSPALRTRALRQAALAAGASASALRAEHVWAVEELVTRWRGQQPVPLPSGVQARRHDGRITLSSRETLPPGPTRSISGPTKSASGAAGSASGATRSRTYEIRTADPAGTPSPIPEEPRIPQEARIREELRAQKKGHRAAFGQTASRELGPPAEWPGTVGGSVPTIEEDVEVTGTLVGTVGGDATAESRNVPDGPQPEQPQLERPPPGEPFPERSSLERVHPDIEDIVVSKAEISERISELAARVDADYAGREILLVGVLKGAVMVMADFSRALTTPLTMDFMAVSSYGSSTSQSGVVRILKDLDRSIEGRDVLVVEDIIDSGLTLSWLLKNLRSRNPASLEVLALFRKPEAIMIDVDVRYVGFDIPSAFVVGYGLDYGERYRTLPFVGTLTPEAITRGTTS
jgi:hypoxanthine phosphoribosyltransferase